jgi:hypothetical protein
VTASGKTAIFHAKSQKNVNNAVILIHFFAADWPGSSNNFVK